MNGFPYNRLLAIINLYASSLGDLSDLFGINLGHTNNSHKNNLGVVFGYQRKTLKTVICTIHSNRFLWLNVFTHIILCTYHNKFTLKI